MEEWNISSGDHKINWYPGHMAKSRKALQEQLSRIDAVIELCDARIPMASRNPDLSELLGRKPRLLVLNKSDLADEQETRKWMAYLRQNGQQCMAFDSVRGKPRAMVNQAAELTRPVVERYQQRGVRKTVRLMITGIPNVGKSTLVNRLKGNAIAKAGDRPGVTRSNQWVHITPYLELLDTPGLLWPDLSNQEDARVLAMVGTINDDILNREELAGQLLMRLLQICPAAVRDRYHLKEEQYALETVLQAACRGRGWLRQGGVPDTERGASVVLDEFRSGRLGRITLQTAETGGGVSDEEGLAGKA